MAYSSDLLIEGKKREKDPGEISSVMLLGTENPIALAVIRALGAACPGILIHSLSRKSKGTDIARFSRYVHSHNYLEGTTRDQLADEFLRRIEETNADVLLPVDEEFVGLLSLLKNRLGEHIYLPPLPDAGMLNSLIDKKNLNRLLSDHQFPHPITYSPKNLDLDEIGSDFYPCLLKPVRGSSGWGIVRIPDEETLLKKLYEIDIDNYIIQEYVPGINIDCSFLAVDGQIEAMTIQKGLANVGFVFSTAIHFEYNQAVYELVRQLVKMTSFSGLAHLDFRLDERDGQPKLIDFNARFWHSLLGSKAAGIDFAFLWCCAALGIPIEKNRFEERTYLMGKSSIHYHMRNLFRWRSRPGADSTHTDLRDRLRDPLPEIMRILR